MLLNRLRKSRIQEQRFFSRRKGEKMPKELIEILCLLAVLIFISVLMCIFNKDEDFSVREEDEIYNGYYDE